MRWSLMVGVLALMPSEASAQLGYVSPSGDGTYECVEGTPCGSDAECPAPQTCHLLGGSGGFCAPERALYCASDASADPGCPPGLEPYLATFFGLTVCAPASVTGACVGPDCFIAPRTSDTPGAIVRAAFGDCDRDGLINSADPDPCRAAPTIGVVDPSTGQCDVSSAHPCTRNEECFGGSCLEVSEREVHRYCIATDPPVFCCGTMANAVCLNDSPCMPVELDGADVCHGFCVGLGWTFAMRLRCVKDPSDPTRFVEAGAGDCDGDGITNAEELGAEDRDPCVAEDGGVPSELDGGSSDAGAVDDEDGGAASMDGAVPPPPPVQPNFEGGGGCRCRAAAPRSRGPLGGVGWLGLGGLAMLSMRRRGRRHSA